MFEEAKTVTSAPALSNYIQPNLGHGLRIWWAFYWPTALSTFVLVLGSNTALRFYWQNFDVSPDVTLLFVWMMRFDAYVFYYAIAFLVLAYILRKNFRGFRIALLSNRGAEGSELLQPTFRRTARVWWTYSWRAVVYRIVVAFAASFPIGWIVGFLVAFFPNRMFSVLINFVFQIAIEGAVGMFVIYSNILDEDLGEFRVGLIPHTTPAAQSVTPPVVVNP